MIMFVMNAIDVLSLQLLLYTGFIQAVLCLKLIKYLFSAIEL